MAYPCQSRHVSERVNGQWAVVQVTHSIDRHGDRQDDTVDLSTHRSRDAAWLASARLDVFI